MDVDRFNILSEKVKAVAPVVGINWNQRRIDFDSAATDAEIAAAQAILDSFNPEAIENQPRPKMDLEAELNALKDALLRKGTLLQSEIDSEKSKR